MGTGFRKRSCPNNQRPQPASLLQVSCALGLAFSHCVIERVSLFDILLFMQVQYFNTTGADWPSSLLSETQAVIHLVSSALWRCASAGVASVAAATRTKSSLFTANLPMGVDAEGSCTQANNKFDTRCE